jgi:hypothetical protein
MAKSADRILLESKLPALKEDYLKGSSTINLTKKYLPNSKARSSTTLETVIKDMIAGKLPTKITKAELAKRPNIIGTTAKGLSPAKIILANEKAKEEFVKFANTKGNTVMDSMKEAGVIAKKYAPVGTKVSGYTSRTGFIDSGLRNLITQKVQLGRQDVDPAVTSRLNKIQNTIAKTKLPETQIKIDTPIVKTMANKVKMTPAQFLGGVTKLKEIYKTGRKGFTVNPKVESVISRFPDARFNKSLFLSKGYSKKTVRTLDAVEEAAKKITTQGTQLEHSMPKALIDDFKLPRSNYLKGERTSNFLNQFKKQFDNQIINAAKDFRDGKISYDEYKRIVANIVRKVAARTGGYKMGYIDFKDGDPTKAFAVTEQKSILKGEAPRGRKQTGLKNFLKNSVHHNELYRQFTADPNNSDFGTLRDEIKQSKKFKFVPEPELEKLHNATKNLKTTEEIFEFYKKDTPLSKLFRQGFTKAAGNIAKGGRGMKILGGAATLPLFATALAAEQIDKPEVKKPEVGTPIKYDSNIGAIVNERTDQPASQNQILSFIKDNPLAVTAGTSYGFAAQEVPRAYKAARELGRGKVRSALGITGALKPILTTIGTPALTGFYETAMTAKRLEEGESATEILTDPFGPAMGLTFMEPFSRGAGVIRDAPKRTIAQGLRNYFNLSDVGKARPGATSAFLRLGMSPRMIAGASRFLGLPGVLLGTGLSAYDAYKNYQNQEGMIYNLFNKDE